MISFELEHLNEPSSSARQRQEATQEYGHYNKCLYPVTCVAWKGKLLVCALFNPIMHASRDTAHQQEVQVMVMHNREHTNDHKAMNMIEAVQLFLFVFAKQQHGHK